MSKTKKARKQTKEELENIQFIKEWFESYRLTNERIKNIEYFQNEKSETFPVFETKIDFGSFKQIVQYYPHILLDFNCFDFQFKIQNIKENPRIYDIFNVLNINDFAKYYYQNCNNKDMISKALEKIMKCTDTYYFDLEKITNDSFLQSQIGSNISADKAMILQDESDDEDNYVFTSPFFFDIGNENTKSTLKDLQKRFDKNKPLSLYEKRKLEYLKSGNSLKEIDTDVKGKKTINSYKRKFNIIVDIGLLVFFLALLFGLKAIIFKGGEVLPAIYIIGKLKLEFPVGIIGAAIVDTIAFSLIIKSLFKEKIIKAVLPKEYSDLPINNEKKEKFSLLKKCVLTVFMLAISVLISNMALDNVAYYTDHIRVFEAMSVVDVKYKDLEIYKVNEPVESEGEQYENGYAYAYKGHVYELGEVNPDGKAQKHINQIAKDYSKNVKTVKTVEDIK